ncbi:MAG: putative 2-aminoethylphosphonate ABC transporter permease subunit [Pseudanabaena sp.]|jgi:iron(III) transport system permease protein|nr:putative 2-aminoethylphosphonate ABC transporter permease subunit [Pseudanabaena sp. M051S1SP2A07QC]MCA6527468.1 putative 2-aminoethylphosphonate ABC transporter permease subunit [Pseudanabaena sp. M179S2SP2A07QC]MCA6531172.1 putative 2-aminoethylphosphonate ABC transporter permease subunit [Pseudanabaena sp. M125S2SP2A07QC]MCA6535965.1 putative 2-aminoethylphosphonate ABC transporter permease subunit [Pseudanabaena sp. M176S2SP2A07QC]MCA6539969.1 putative 2-aminoethylphosphonate ABC transpo
MTLAPEKKSSFPVKPQAQIQQFLTKEDWILRGFIVLSTLWLLVGVLLPLYPMLIRSFQDADGLWIGLENYVRYFQTPALSVSIFNTFYIAIASAIISVVLGFIYAYALTRTAMFGKPFFRIVGLLPLFIPPLAHSIGLVYLFGNNGLITTGFFSLIAGFDINLYGSNGIIIGEVLYCFPQAVILLMTALSITDARLYEAAAALRTPAHRVFFTVTLPSVKYGLMSSVFVCFTLAFTDFGVPKVVGGGFNVLSTDIYKQVIGQQNFSMGATIGVFLLLPTVISYVLDRLFQGRQTALVSSRSVPLQPSPNPKLDWLMLAFCSVIVSFILLVFGTIIFASLVKIWPYDLSLTTKHYDFDAVGGGGLDAYWNSIKVSLYTAVFGTIAVFMGAYLVEKGKGFKLMRSFNYFLSTIPLALPGLVLGLSYVFFFNKPLWNIPYTNLALVNPFNGLYGTLALLVICNIIHFYTVGFLTASTALKQIDPEFESVSASMGVPFYKTFWLVTIPLTVPALLELGSYFFVNSMVTISAIIFLYPPNAPLAAVAIVNMDDAGDIAPAAAMSMALVLTSIGVRILYWLLTKGLSQSTQKWLKK